MQILQKRKKQGFTLSELMAVVVILAILAAIGMSSYRKIMEKAIFNEGLSVGHAVAAAYDEYYYEYHKVAENIGKLTLDLKGATQTASSVSTKHFTVKIATGRTVQVLPNGGSYVLIIYPEVYWDKPDECKGLNADGLDFCETMGYITCSSNVCTKL